MEEATKSAETVREDIQKFRNSCTYVNSSDVCDVCNIMILIRPFYIFPCQHKFHSDCLREELEPLLGEFSVFDRIVAKSHLCKVLI